MKNRYNIFLFVFLTLAYICSGHSAAAEPNYGGACTETQQQQIMQDLTAKLQEEFSKFQSAVSTYNPLASDYLKSCEEISHSPNESLRFSVEEEATAKTNGVDVSDKSLYEYLNIPWGQVRPTKDSCKVKKERVQKAFDPVMIGYQRTRQSIQALINRGATRCTCSEDGQEVICTNIDKKTQDAENKKGRCGSFTGLMQSLSNCPLCGIFETILSASARVAHVAWEYTAKPLSEVVGIFFLVLLAFEVLKAVASVGGMKISAFLKRVMGIGLKIAVTILLLSESQYIYTLFISPVLQGGLDMGLAIATAGGNGECSAGTMGGVIISQELDSALFNKILDTVRCFGSVASTLPAIGMGLICHSFPEFSIWNIIRVNVLPSFSMLFSGFIMLGFGVMIWMSVSFYLIDCVVQIGMLTALVPFLIACWPFKITEQYTIKGVKMLMNTFFNFAMMGTVLLFGSQIIAFSLSGEGDLSMQDLLFALNNDLDDKLKGLTSLDSMRVILLCACCIFALKLIGKVDALANQFSQGAGSSIGKDLGSAATQTATALGKRALHDAGRGVGYVGSALLEKSGTKAWANKTLDGALALRRRALGGVGKMLGLGRFQNKQTGSGLPDIGGGGAGAGGNPPLPPPGGGGAGGGNNPPLPNNDAASDNNTPLDNINTPEENGGNGTPTGNERPNGGDNGGGNNNGDAGGARPQSSEGPAGGERSRGAETHNSQPNTQNNNNSGDNGGGDNGGNKGGAGNNGGSSDSGDNDNAGNNGDNNGDSGDNGGENGGSGDNGDSGDNGGDSTNNNTGNNNNAQNIQNKRKLDHEAFAAGTRVVMMENAVRGHDSSGNKVITTSNNDGAVTQTSVNDKGNATMSTTIDKEGNITDKSYHENGKLASVTNMNADGSSSSQRFDNNGNLTSESTTDKNGNNSWKKYNTDGTIKEEGSNSKAMAEKTSEAPKGNSPNAQKRNK